MKRLVCVAVLLACAGVAAAGPEKILLKRVFHENTSTSYRFTLSMPMPGGDPGRTVTTRIDLRESVLRLDKVGVATVKTDLSNAHVKIGDAEQPGVGDQPLPTVMETLSPDGKQLDVKLLDAGPQAGMFEALGRVNRIMFSGKPVAIGDKWGFETKVGDLDPTVKHTYELVAFELFGGFQTAKIKVKSETIINTSSKEFKPQQIPTTMEGYAWIDRSNGEPVRVELVGKKFRGPFGISEAKFTLERLTGSSKPVVKPSGDPPGIPRP